MLVNHPFDPIFSEHERRHGCFFGISEAIAIGISAAVASTTAAVAGAIGTGIIADAIGTGLVYGAIGAAGGAVVGGITGSSPLKGAEAGFLTGFGGGAGGAVAGIAGGAVGGAAGGALGGAATGTDPLTGAITGAVAGGASAAAAGDSAFAPAQPAGGAAAGAGATADAATAPQLSQSQVALAVDPTAAPVSAPGTPGGPADLGSVGPGSGANGALSATSLGDNSIGGTNASVLTSGQGAPVLTGAGSSPPAGSTTLGADITNSGTGLNLSTAPASSTPIPTGLDATASANFASDSGASPYATGLTNNVTGGSANALSSAGAGPAAEGSGISSGGKLALAAAPAALALLKGQPAVPSNIQPLTTGGAVTAPLINAENQRLGEASSGILQPGEAAQIAQYTQSAESTLRQQLFAEGVTDPTKDSRYITGMAQIGQQQQVMTQQFLTQALSTGLSAAGEASSALTTAANAQLATDAEFQKALSSAMTSFGLVMGFSGLKAAA